MAKYPTEESKHFTFFKEQKSANFPTFFPFFCLQCEFLTHLSVGKPIIHLIKHNGKPLYTYCSRHCTYTCQQLFITFLIKACELYYRLTLC